MKFLIQTIDKKVVHDFSFTLIESCKYQIWRGNKVRYMLTDNKILPNFIPIGSVEFVSNYLETYYEKIPKPINIPEELLKEEFTRRKIILGTEKDVLPNTFVKSMDKIKSFTEVITEPTIVPEGNYIISELIDIESEWRAFVFKGNIVGLQNYSGDFMTFPDTYWIQRMVDYYKSAPVAYTLDVGIVNSNTVIIEVHDFFSCGLYGFSSHSILPYMFSQWFYEYIKK